MAVCVTQTDHDNFHALTVLVHAVQLMAVCELQGQYQPAGWWWLGAASHQRP